MCEANVYISENGRESLMMKEVDIIRPEEGGLFLRSVQGEQKMIKGKITDISLVNHKIVIEKNFS
ncbi:MAG: CooT family nickel-binding protein [bacterium]